MLPVHVLLGKALLDNGDFVAAEVAFQEALRLGQGRHPLAGEPRPLPAADVEGLCGLGGATAGVVGLERADAIGGLGDPRTQRGVGGAGGQQRGPGGHLVLGVAAQEQRVAASADRGDRGLADAVVIGDRLHVEIVGHDHAAVAEALAQEPGDHRR